MKSSIVQKTARIAFVILLATLCVLFACACRGDPVSISNLTLEGEILPGVELHSMAFLLGGEKEVARYLDVQGVLEVIEGQDVATADGTKIRIADTAKAGDVFKVALTIKDLRFEKEFTVAASEVATVQVLCSNNVEAGETITLSARIYPEGASSREPTYYLVSGEATVEGNELKIDPNADQGEVVVKAVLEGVESPNKRVQISTVQTRSLSWDAPESLRVLPGETILCRAVKYPENSSFGVSISFEKGADAVDYDEGSGFLRIKESAEIPSEIRLVARSGNKEARLALRVAYPDVAAIVTQGSGSVAPGAERSFSFSVEPEDADPSSVRISVVQGNDCIEWTGGASFRVNANASQGEEITFLLTAGEVYRTVSFVVESRVLSSLTIATTGSTDYLKSGESLTFTHVAEPVENDGIVNYRAKVGADLVTIEGETVTVKEGAGIGRVVVVAEGADGTVSNEIEFTVSGKYDRRVYSSWSNVGLSPTGEQSCVWMVLPNALNAGVMTVLVPADVVDLVIEGRYEGGDETAYKDVYFYFRNTAERSVTLWNFGVIATQGLGGTVMDFGSSGTTELRLWGQNLVRADSPYLIDNSEEDKDGVWDVGASYSSYESLTLLRRSGKYGYRGAAGGTAISGYALNFTGEGTLEAVAGSGANGTAGGKGANARYGEGIATYLSGAGGDGGHGGDSGAAIYAYSVRFGSGLVTALPGNAGRGAAGGAAGSLDALAGKDVTAISGGAGTRGNDGVCYPAIRATQISGENYLSSLGSLQSRETTFDGSLVEFEDQVRGRSGQHAEWLQNDQADRRFRASRSDAVFDVHDEHDAQKHLAGTFFPQWQDGRDLPLQVDEIQFKQCARVDHFDQRRMVRNFRHRGPRRLLRRLLQHHAARIHARFALQLRKIRARQLRKRTQSLQSRAGLQDFLRRQRRRVRRDGGVR